MASHSLGGLSATLCSTTSGDASATSLSAEQYNMINTIVNKLGHHLNEIKARALENLLSKLDVSYTISERDLADNRQLFANLFELLNLDEFHRKEDALKLIRRLAKFPESARHIWEMGGVKFLNDFKQELIEQAENPPSANGTASVSSLSSSSSTSHALPPENPQTLIDLSDELIEYLLKHSGDDSSLCKGRQPPLRHYNSTSGNMSSMLSVNVAAHSSGASSNPPSSVSCSAISSGSSSSMVSSSSSSSSRSSSSTNRTLVDSRTTSQPARLVSTSLVKDSVDHMKRLDLNSLSEKAVNEMSELREYAKHLERLDSSSFYRDSQPTTHDFNQRSARSIVSSNELTHSYSCNRSSIHETNYKESLLMSQRSHVVAHPSQIHQHANKQQNNEDVLTFYWVSLSETDKKLLRNAENCLKSSNSKKIKSYSQFLRTVVFNDFPAEIFLQRSGILKIMYELILNSSTGDRNLTMSRHGHSEGGDHEEGDSLLECLLGCLNHYCVKLKQRLRFIKDPSTFQYKDLFSNNFEYMTKSIYLKSFSRSARKDRGDLTGELDLELESTASTIGTTTSSFAKSTASTKSSSIASKRPKSAASQKPAVASKSGVKPAVKEPTSQRSSSEAFVGLCDQLRSTVQMISNEQVLEQVSVRQDLAERSKSADEWSVFSFCFSFIELLVDVINMKMMAMNSDLLSVSHVQAPTEADTQNLPIMFELLQNLMLILVETKKEWSVCIDKKALDKTFIEFFDKLNLNIKYFISKLHLLGDQHEPETSINSFSSSRSMVSSASKLAASSSDLKVNKKFLLNRLCYELLIKLVFNTINLVESINQPLLFPTSMVDTLFIILNDVCFLEAFNPRIQETFRIILKSMDRRLFDLLTFAKIIGDQSIKSAYYFLTKCPEQDEELAAVKQELIDRAKRSLNFMDYHVCLVLPKRIVDFCAKLIYLEDESDLLESRKFNPGAAKTQTKPKPIEKLLDDCEYLVTSCMINRNDQLRVETYAAIYKIVDECLNLNNAACEPSFNRKKRNGFKRLYLLLLNKPFYQLVTFGLFDHNGQVKKYAENVVSRLLQIDHLVSSQGLKERLSQLVVTYMPFLQCLASTSSKIGQAVLNMSNEVLTGAVSDLDETTDGQLLRPNLERLKTSLRYLFFRDKTLRKNGFQQSIAMLAKYNQGRMRERSHGEGGAEAVKSFDYSDFFVHHPVEFFSDMCVKLNNSKRVFARVHESSLASMSSLGQTSFKKENLASIFNIFLAESRNEQHARTNESQLIKQNALEQVTTMLSFGDANLHAQFLNMDGCNFLIRYLNRRRLSGQTAAAGRVGGGGGGLANPLNSLKKDQLDRVDANCVNCLLSLFYWNKSLRTRHAFDAELLDLIVRHLVICYNLLNKKEQLMVRERASAERVNAAPPAWTPLKSIEDKEECYYLLKCQEDLAALLYLLIFNQVSCLREYYELQEKEAQKLSLDVHTFDLSRNIKAAIFEPFTTSSGGLSSASTGSMASFVHESGDRAHPVELKLLEIQQMSVYELNFKFNSLLLEINAELTTEEHQQRRSCLSLIHINDLLNRRFKLVWNKYWHGGTTFDQLVYDMLFNEALLQTGLESTNPKYKEFTEAFFLNETDLNLVKYSMPGCVFKLLLSDLSLARGHQEVLTSYSLIQVLLQVVKFEFSQLHQLQADQTLPLSKLEFFIDYAARPALVKAGEQSDESFLHKIIDKSLEELMFDKWDHKPAARLGWHSAFDRFSSRPPSNNPLDKALYLQTYQTINQILRLQLGHDLYLASTSSVIACSAATDWATSEDALDAWLLGLVNDDVLVRMLRQLLQDYRDDEMNNFMSLQPLCEYIGVFYERQASSIRSLNAVSQSQSVNKLIGHYESLVGMLPPVQLFQIILEQIQSFQTDYMNQLSKITVLMSLLSSLLRSSLEVNEYIANQVALFGQGSFSCTYLLRLLTKKYWSLSSNQMVSLIEKVVELDAGAEQEVTGEFLQSPRGQTNNNIVFVNMELVKLLIQVINSFHVNRDGLSISFMSSYILKTAHVSLVQLFQNTMLLLRFLRLTENHDLTAIQAMPNLSGRLRSHLAMELVRRVVAPSQTSLPGISWLIPLLLSRESQIRSMSLGLLSSLVFNDLVQDAESGGGGGPAFQVTLLNVHLEPLFKIAINIMFNNFECSLVRTQAAGLLINYVKSVHAACKGYAEASSRARALKKPATAARKDSAELLRRCLSRLRASLSEARFFERVCSMFSNFYPFKTYEFHGLKSFFPAKASAAESRNFSEYEVLDQPDEEPGSSAYDDSGVVMSVSSPLLLSAVCQLLTNILVTFSFAESGSGDAADLSSSSLSSLSSSSSSGPVDSSTATDLTYVLNALYENNILDYTINYLKPIDLLLTTTATANSGSDKAAVQSGCFNQNLVQMLMMMLKFLRTFCLVCQEPQAQQRARKEAGRGSLARNYLIMSLNREENRTFFVNLLSSINLIYSQTESEAGQQQHLSNKEKLMPFYICLFDFVNTVFVQVESMTGAGSGLATSPELSQMALRIQNMNNELEKSLIASASKCWPLINKFLIDELTLFNSFGRDDSAGDEDEDVDGSGDLDSTGARSRLSSSQGEFESRPESDEFSSSYYYCYSEQVDAEELSEAEGRHHKKAGGQRSINLTSIELISNLLKFHAIYLNRQSENLNDEYFVEDESGDELTSGQNDANLLKNIRILFDKCSYSSAVQSGGHAESLTFGEQLCRELIKQFDKYFLTSLFSVGRRSVQTPRTARQSLKLFILNDLKCMFLFSKTCKQYAINESGFIETLIEHLKCTHSKLNLKSLSVSASSKSGAGLKAADSGVDKELVYIDDLEQTFILLRCLMSNDSDIKEQVAKCGIHSLIQSLWCWSLKYSDLLIEILNFLCSFTCNNKFAVSLLTQNNLGLINDRQRLLMMGTSNSLNDFLNAASSNLAATGAGASATNPANLNLLHTIIKTLQKYIAYSSNLSSINLNMNLQSASTTSKSDSASTAKTVLVQLKQISKIIAYSFTVLINCSLSNECKSIIWKSNLLQELTQTDLLSVKMNSQMATRLAPFLESQASSSKANTTSALFNMNNLNLIRRDRLLLNLMISLSLNNSSFALSDEEGQAAQQPNILMKLNNLLPILIRFIDLNLVAKLTEFINMQVLSAKDKSTSSRVNKMSLNENGLVHLLKYQLDNQYNALLVLRNLTFNPLNKSKLITSQNYIELLVKCLKVNNSQFQLVAISAIYSLIFEYQKAKVVFKNANLIQYLIDLNESLHAVSNDAYSDMRQQSGFNKSQTIVEKIKTILCQLMKLISD